jgi:hypothetical protein
MKTHDFLINAWTHRAATIRTARRAFFRLRRVSRPDAGLDLPFARGCDGAWSRCGSPWPSGRAPGGLVEWITLAMFGAFAYAVGFMIPLV